MHKYNTVNYYIFIIKFTRYERRLNEIQSQPQEQFLGIATREHQAQSGLFTSVGGAPRQKLHCTDGHK